MEKVSINISSHNINGFNGSSHYLKARCESDSDSVLCVQEHWLRPAYKNIKSINQLRVVHPHFDGYGVSAMRDIHNESVRVGRPYGGTAFIFNKQFQPFLRPLIQYEHERISVMEILDKDGSIIIINVYFPFRQNSDDHKVSYLETLGCVKHIMDTNPTSKFIVLGDLNYDIYNSHFEISQILREFVVDYDLCISHEMDGSFDQANSFTRCCLKSGSYSLLDFILFSRSLRERVSNCRILYDGANPSDHFPVQIQLEVVPQHTGESGQTTLNKSGKIDWSSLTDEELFVYRDVMDTALDNLQVPSGILHGDKSCTCPSHKVDLEKYYQMLVDTVIIADSFLPRKSPKGKGGKDFWSDSLTQMKSDSISSYNEWQSAGRPSSGPFFEKRKSCHYLYKTELRRQRRQCASENSEALGQKLLDKDYRSFWKDWKRESQTRAPLVNRIGDSISEPDICKTFKNFYEQIYGEDDTEAHRSPNLMSGFHTSARGSVKSPFLPSFSPGRT